MFKFYFLDDDIKYKRSFYSNTNTLYCDIGNKCGLCSELKKISRYIKINHRSLV
jgi:hypothetical protein